MEKSYFQGRISPYDRVIGTLKIKMPCQHELSDKTDIDGHIISKYSFRLALKATSTPLFSNIVI